MRAGRGIETGEQSLLLLEALVPEAVRWGLEADWARPAYTGLRATSCSLKAP